MTALSPSTSSKQHGLTLVELLIALAIGLFLVGAIAALYVNTRSSFTYSNEVARIQETGRFALDTISRDIRMAGYNGCSRSVTTLSVVNNSSANPLLDITTPIRGFEGGSLPSVLTAAGAINASDALILIGGSSSGEMVVSSHDPALAQIDSFGHSVKSGEFMMVTDCSKATMFQVSAVATDNFQHNTGGSPGNCSKFLGAGCPVTGGGVSYVYQPGSSIMRVFSNAYFIGDSSLNNGTRSLYSMALEGTSGTPVKRELLTNVEDMQILYGVDNDSNGVIDKYDAASAISDWSKVVSVRISLLVRSTGTNVTSAAQPYTYMDTQFTPTDRALRQVFAETVVARNRSY